MREWINFLIFLVPCFLFLQGQWTALCPTPSGHNATQSRLRKEKLTESHVNQLKGSSITLCWYELNGVNWSAFWKITDVEQQFKKTEPECIINQNSCSWGVENYSVWSNFLFCLVTNCADAFTWFCRLFLMQKKLGQVKNTSDHHHGNRKKLQVAVKS